MKIKATISTPTRGSEYSEIIEIDEQKLERADNKEDYIYKVCLETMKEYIELYCEEIEE
jgi:hypothetical protein